MIRITSDTDCYYCTIKSSYQLPVYDFHGIVIIADILILLHWGNSSCMNSDYGDMRLRVYRWGFSYLNYFFDVLTHEAIYWVCTTSFAVFALIRFYFRFLVLLLYHICLHPDLPLVFYSTSLLFLSYYIMHAPCFISLTISACFYMPVLTTQFFITCSFDSDLSIHVCFSMHATWHSPYHLLGSFWLP